MPEFINHATGEPMNPPEDSLLGFDIEGDDPHQQWLDMPEFVQDNRQAFKRVVVNFNSQEDIEEFNRRTGLSVSVHTKGVFFPDHSGEEQVEYVDEP